MNKNKYYFTFGSNSQFPYINNYLIVLATSESKAISKFRKKYPDVHENIINCSFVYSESEWTNNNMKKYYPYGAAEIIK